MEFIKKLWNDESGASAAEYALLLALVSIFIVVAVGNLGTAIAGAVQGAADVIAP